jgi:signal transduction histidine kinase/ligand-binding sensor domain-containing protein
MDKMKALNLFVKYMNQGGIVIISLLGYFILSFSPSIYAQDEYNFETLPIASEKMGINGQLSQGRVSDIIEDERGLIWIGTLDGLNRYDGYKIKVFRHQFEDSTSLDNNQIVKILNTNEGYLWVLTKTGINRFNVYTELSSLVKFPDNFNKIYQIYDIALDKTQNLWIARSDGLYVLKNGSDVIERIELDVYFPDTRKLEIDYLNNVWIGSSKNYLVRYNHRLKNVKLFKYPRIPEDEMNTLVFDIHQDKENNIWVALYNKQLFDEKVPNIFVLEKGSDSLRFFDDYVPILKKNGHRTFLSTTRKFESRKGELYISAISNGLALIEHAKKKFTYMPEYMDFRWHTEIDKNVIFFDSNNDLWLGSNGEGVFILPAKKDLFGLVNKNNRKNFKLKSVRSFYEFKDFIYVGGYSGIAKMNKATQQIKTLKLDHVVYCIDKYPHDSRFLLIGSEGNGLIKYDPQTDEYVSLIDKWTEFKGYEEPWMWIFDIYNDGDSLVWCGAQNGILKYSVTNKSSEIYINSKENDFKFGQVFNIYRDFEDRLFAGGDGSGLLIYNETKNKFERFFNKNFPYFDFSSFRVNHITQTQDSVYWISTDKGLIEMSKHDLRVISKDEGLLNDFVYCVIPDQDGKLWMSTNDGVYSYNRESKEMSSFSVYDRLQGQEFNTAAYYKSKDGTIYLGGVKGFNYFKPEKIFQRKREIPIEIIGFYLNNEEYKPDKQQALKRVFEIPPEIEYFKIDFSALSYHGNPQFRYKYKINELHDNWIDLNHSNELGFHSLAPGAYTLYILAADQHGNWNTHPFEIKINVKSYFWETDLFKYGLIVLIILLIFIILNYRYILLKQQKFEIEKTVRERTMELSIVNEELIKANDTKNKFLKIISHDIKNPLSAAQSVSIDLIENVDNYTKKEKAVLLDVLNSSMLHLQTLLDNLRRWSSLQNKEMIPEFGLCNIRDLIQNNVKLFSASLLKKKIELNEHIEGEVYIYADCKMVDAIIRNLISNAIKFSHSESSINISAHKKDDFVEIQIEDNGVGMTEEQVDNLFIPGLSQSLPGTENEKGTGFGLLMVIEFVKLNKGKINVISAPNRGSRFILAFPTGK